VSLSSSSPTSRFARWARETSSHPRCVQFRTHLPASMFVIELTWFLPELTCFSPNSPAKLLTSQ
jgi:hypothetical protein